MKSYRYTTAIFLLFILNSCVISQNNIVVKEIYQTIRNEDDNVDSPTYWEGTDGEHWIISTCKGTHSLLVDDALTGKNILRIGSKGVEPGKFVRPNGIFAIDSLLFVVERNNHRIQVLTLPDFKTLITFGDSTLIKPYGIFVNKLNDSLYNIYVTDNYETSERKTPPDSLLGKRSHIYELLFSNRKVESKLLKMFGDTSGNGVLRIVESVWADPGNNVLLFSEEDTTQSCLKVYNLKGNYSGKTFGNGLFNGQVEGLALYKCDNGKGLWIVTDQSHEKNKFLFFDRITFEYIGSFSGSNTTNTDGIWLAQKPIQNFEQGLFFAVHNDGNVSAFDFHEILSKLGLENYCE